jgi:hypothetical protein
MSRGKPSPRLPQILKSVGSNPGMVYNFEEIANGSAFVRKLQNKYAIKRRFTAIPNIFLLSICP